MGEGEWVFFEVVKMAILRDIYTLLLRYKNYIFAFSYQAIRKPRGVVEERCLQRRELYD